MTHPTSHAAERAHSVRRAGIAILLVAACGFSALGLSGCASDTQAPAKDQAARSESQPEATPEQTRAQACDIITTASAKQIDALKAHGPAKNPEDTVKVIVDVFTSFTADLHTVTNPELLAMTTDAIDSGATFVEALKAEGMNDDTKKKLHTATDTLQPLLDTCK